MLDWRQSVVRAARMLPVAALLWLAGSVYLAADWLFRKAVGR